MLNKTITKISTFVILSAAFGLAGSACHEANLSKREKPVIDRTQSPYGEPQVIGKLESGEINESSGLAASKCQADVYWTHNDSGDDAFVFAINSKGTHLGTWKLPNARNLDWEDIAAFKDNSDTCFLYIGEIGNTKDNERSEHIIYRVKEPVVSPENKESNRKNSLTTENAEILRFNYPDDRHDAETLLVHPKTGDIYVLTKRVDGPSAVYKLKPDFTLGAVQPAAKIAETAVPTVPNGLLTGGSISTDGTHVAVCDYSAGYELVLPENAKDFDEIWKTKPVAIDIGDRKQGEAISYSADGNSLIATSEGKNSPVFEIKRRQ